MTEIVKSDKSRKTEIPVCGMHCASCVAKVEGIIKAVPGVGAVSVNLATNSATLTEGSAGFDLRAVVDSLNRSGYPAKLAETRLSISGMHCASCVANIEKHLLQIDGVVEAAVNLTTGSGTIKHLAVDRLQEKISTAFAGSGYTATIADDDHQDSDPTDSEVAGLRWPLLFSLAAAAITMFIMAGEHFHFFHMDPEISGHLQFVLATAVYFWCGKRFHLGFWHSLKRKSADMNTLISLGTSAAYFFSVVVLFKPSLFPTSGGHPEFYFDTAIMIIALILLGRYLEAKARSRSSSAIRKLLEARPDEATVIIKGAEKQKRSEYLEIGDIVRVRPGERIAADGEIIVGSGALNESMLTGEALPVDKQIGDQVTGGTINTSGSFDFRVTTSQSESRLTKIAAMVRQALSAKPQIQRLVDKVASIFVPIVIALSVLTMVIWLITGAEFAFALKAFIAVLIIACPCALGLATPVAIMVGIGRGAGMGILFRSGDSLEQISKVSTMFFDKTGTLTNGVFSVATVYSTDQFSNQFLRLVASVESKSEHPLAKAVVDYARLKGVATSDVQDFVSYAGAGAEGSVEGRRVLLGTARFFQYRKIDLSTLAASAERELSQGRSVMFAAIDGVAAGFITLGDAVKADAAAAVQELTALGVATMMLTGDNALSAQSVARAIGIDSFKAELLPQQKLNAISEAKTGGLIIGMVGDGINDAPALAAADIGIALSSGSDIAVESAAVTLTGSDLRKVPQVIRLARAIVRNIKQNLFWAFFYNVITIPIAAGVLYPAFGIQLSPIIAAAAMSLSSVCVVTNALRLKRFS